MRSALCVLEVFHQLGIKEFAIGCVTGYCVVFGVASRAGSPGSLSRAITVLSETRSSAEERGRWLKDNVSAESSTYKQLRWKYTGAMSACNAWIDGLISEMNNGGTLTDHHGKDLDSAARKAHEFSVSAPVVPRPKPVFATRTSSSRWTAKP